MAGEWRTVEFGDVLRDGTRNGIYKKKEFHGSGVKIVNMGELFAYSRLHAIPMKRVQLTDRELQKSTLQRGDLLFARRSLVAEGAGKCSVVLDVDEPTTFESSIIRGCPDPEKADSLFLYYLFNSPLGLHLLGTIRRQVAVAGITGSDLVKLKIPLPPLDEQQAIAHILGTLDDKIELNRRMNQTLEAMARAIFKSWFVDFDPVRVKANAQSAIRIPQSILATFPDSLEDSPIGPIPKGWRVGCLGDVAENPRRGIQPTDLDTGTPYIALEHMPRRSIALDQWGILGGVVSSKFEFHRGEILFGKLRPYFHKVGVAPLDGVCSTDILVIVPKPLSWFGFVLGHISSTDFVAYTNAMSIGTKMPRTNWKDMARYQVVLPPEEVAAAFTAKVEPLTTRLQANIHEFRTLGATRDALLPKLLSGEIRVPEAETAVEEVAQ